MFNTEKNQQLNKIVEGMDRVKVLIIGDVMLDTYEWCEVKRISPEAPVPIASIINNSHFLGGAGNAANNVRALGAHVSLVSVIGADVEGEIIKRLLSEKDIDHEGVIIEEGRPTTLKTRIFSGSQQLLRVDREVTSSITEETKKSVRDLLTSNIKESDVVIISDYCKGILTDDVIAWIKEEGHKEKKKVFVDSKNKHLLKYEDVYLVKPNKEEAELFAGEKFSETYSNLPTIGNKLSKLFSSNLVITLGKDGIALFEGNHFYHKTTVAQQVFDVSGAGDTVLATLAVAVGAGAPLTDAVDLSNIAAGHVVSLLGTTVCTQQILEEGIQRLTE